MTTDKSIRRLHSVLCNELGFSLDLAAVEGLSSEHGRDDVQFAEAVFRAEGLDPDLADRHLFRRVRQVIREAEAGY